MKHEQLIAVPSRERRQVVEQISPQDDLKPMCNPLVVLVPSANRLKVSLPDDLPASLADGVVLCHLINHIRKGMIPSIHIPSAGVVRLDKNYFIIYCRFSN